MQASQRRFHLGIYERILCFIVLFWAAAASFHGYDTRHGLNYQVKGLERFRGMLDGTASRPFIYRQLLPATANEVDRLVPGSFKTRLASLVDGDGEKFYEAVFALPQQGDLDYFFRSLILYIEIFLSAFAAAYFMFLMCMEEGVAPIASLAASVLFILLLPYIMSEGGGKIYDYAELAFFALSIWMLRRFHWWWLVPVAVLATLNKESYLFFLITLYPVIRRRYSLVMSLVALGVLAAVCAGVYAMIWLHFRNSPGSTVEVHFQDVLRYYFKPQHFIGRPLVVYGIFAVDILSILPIAFIVWTIRRGWGKLSREFRRHAQLAAIINLPLFFLFCWPGEARNLSMLYLPLVLCFAFNFAGFTGMDTRTVKQS